MPGFATKNWSLLKKSMKTAFLDEDQFKYALGDLRKFVSKQKRRGKPDKLSKISKVYFKFTEITTYLKNKKTISSQEESRYFLSILPTDIVDMIYDRRATRQLVRAEEHDGYLGSEDEDDEGALPDIKEIMKELRSIFAGFAKRGKTSRIRGKRDYDSTDSEDSESTSGSSDLSDEEESETDDSEAEVKSSKSKGSRTSRKGGSSRSSKSGRSSSSKSGDSDKGTGKKRDSKSKSGNESSKDDIGLKDFLKDLQVQVAQLATTQKNAGLNGMNGGSNFQPKKPFVPYNQVNTTPFAGKWGAKHRDPPPHDIQNNNAEYEGGYYEMNYAGNAPPAKAATGVKNPWPMKTGNEPMFNAPPPKVPSCLWCLWKAGLSREVTTTKSSMDIDTSRQAGIHRGCEVGFETRKNLLKMPRECL
ncbi:hypothetical protein P7C70_g9413, partial [Phenoliferia sp. Uapishka_3]